MKVKKIDGIVPNVVQCMHCYKIITILELLFPEVE